MKRSFRGYTMGLVGKVIDQVRLVRFVKLHDGRA
jgi:hypothetical protein